MEVEGAHCHRPMPRNARGRTDMMVLDLPGGRNCLTGRDFEVGIHGLCLRW